ncbi:MAG: hypothetical protein ACI35S_07820 [Anaeroplasma sp.]
MFKTILKVVYVAFAVVIAVFVYMMSYQVAAVEGFMNKLNNFIAEEDYDSVVRMFGGLFNSEEIARAENDYTTSLVYEGTIEAYYNYYTIDGENEVTNTYHSYDKAFYFYLFNPTFNTQNVSSDVVTNSSALRFYAGDSYYDYQFVITSNVNSSSYIAKPSTLKETYLNSKRDKITEKGTTGFFNFVIDEKTIEFIQEELGGTIDSYNIIDGKSDIVFESNISIDLDTETQFFNDISSVFEAYKEFIPIYDGYNNGSITKAEYQAGLSAFNEKTDELDQKLADGTFSTYYVGFTQSELISSSLVWRSIGIVALYALCIVIIYILIFKFAWIKSLVFRNHRGNYRAVPNKLPKKDVIDAKTNEVNKDEK